MNNAKGSLSFDSKRDLLCALHAGDFVKLIDEFLSSIRKTIKYAPDIELRVFDVLVDIRSKIWDLARDHEVADFLSSEAIGFSGDCEEYRPPRLISESLEFDPPAGVSVDWQTGTVKHGDRVVGVLEITSGGRCIYAHPSQQNFVRVFDSPEDALRGLLELDEIEALLARTPGIDLAT